MSPLRSVETLDEIADRIRDGGPKLKKPNRKILQKLQSFELSQLVGSMLNTLHAGIERQTQQIVKHQTFITAAVEAGVPLATLQAAHKAVNGSNAGELYPDADMDQQMGSEDEDELEVTGGDGGDDDGKPSSNPAPKSADVLGARRRPFRS